MEGVTIGWTSWMTTLEANGPHPLANTSLASRKRKVNTSATCDIALMYGVDLYKVQRPLGHKSPLMTQRYVHHYPESLRDGVDRLVSTKSSQSVRAAEQTMR
jgi:integrase